MCGRFTLTCPGERLAQVFGLPGPPGQPARYNIAPTQPVLVLVPGESSGELKPLLFRWGLTAPWGGRAALINARAESVAQKPAFRAAYRQRRCLIPADGFLEWRRQGTRKTPYHFRFQDRRPFAMAGIWQPAPAEEQGLQGTTAILTTVANALVAPLHDRMPLILAPDRLASWLQEEAPDPELLASLRTPFPADEMEAVEVHPRVNDARNQGPDCLEESG